jgi:LmbE family N-acetylglucosaminyl deacetylase
MIGNGDGLGEVREKELYRAYERLGVPAEKVTILDDPYVLTIIILRQTESKSTARWYGQPLGLFTRLTRP